jgi:benzoyl-CoA 2,3-dioxygenase component B
MLTEEAHHMFVGETGVGRVIRRTLEGDEGAGHRRREEDPQRGAIDLPTIQKFMNFWFTSSLDLFGSEASSNAANYFSNGLKGRPTRAKFADHVESDTTMTIQVPDGRGGVKDEAISVRNGINEITRLEYAKDCNVGVTRWNMLVKRAGVPFEFKLPSTRFRRQVGAWAGLPTDPQASRSRRRIRREEGRVAADRGGHRLRQEPDAARDRARQDGRLDRAAGPRHQRAAGRLRVREALIAA